MQTQLTQKLRLLPTKSPYVSNVAVALDFQTRVIGTLDKAGQGTFISTKRTAKHLFKKTNALGVNLELLHAFPFRWVVVPYEGRQLWTSRIFILAKGRVFTFGKAGFEPQVFLPLDEWDINKAKAFEATLGTQGDFFSGEAA